LEILFPWLVNFTNRVSGPLEGDLCGRLGVQNERQSFASLGAILQKRLPMPSV